MKKRILFGLFGVVAMAAAAIVTVSTVNASSTESDLLSKNIEALTRYEVIGYGDCNEPWSNVCMVQLTVELPGVFYPN